MRKLADQVRSLETDVTALKTQQPTNEGQIDTLAAAVQGLHVKSDHLEQKTDALMKSQEHHTNQINGLKFEMSQLRNWLDDKFAGIDSRFAAIDTRFAAIEAQLSNIGELLKEKLR